MSTFNFYEKVYLLKMKCVFLASSTVTIKPVFVMAATAREMFEIWMKMMNNHFKRQCELKVLFHLLFSIQPNYHLKFILNFRHITFRYQICKICKYITHRIPITPIECCWQSRVANTLSRCGAFFPSISMFFDMNSTKAVKLPVNISKYQETFDHSLQQKNSYNMCNCQK